MSMFKKILLGIGIAILLLITLIVIFIGPWPTYSASYEGTSYFKKDLALIDDALKQTDITKTPGSLSAGWGTGIMTPDVGVPLGGLSSRKGKPSTGVHDELHVKALALGDGKDTAVIVGTDMLIIPPNIAQMVREEVGRETPLTPNQIHFTASHTHSGPGAFGPGLAAWISAGKYDPKVPMFIASMASKAIIEAYKNMAPAKLAHGSVSGAQFIRNRARDTAEVDSNIDYLIAEKITGGQRCYLVRFSAHPTILPDENMQFSAEFPGCLQAAIEKETGGACMYVGGSLGSSGPRAPEASDPYEKIRMMGDGLAKLVLDAAKEPKFETKLDIASVGVPIQLPSFQLRLNNNWRLSPLAAHIAGLETSGWMQATKIGNMIFVGVPCDFSGEISLTWKQWAASKGIDLVPTSFCAAYVGYVSPDKYYGQKGYETKDMSWIGPHQEGFLTALMQDMVNGLTGNTQTAAN